MTEYDSTADTFRHALRVRELMGQPISELVARSVCHDRSKTEDPELSVFNEFTPKLRWQQFIDEMMPPRLTEPIKLTPGQWALLPHGDPRIPTDGQIGDLFGVPVVMVEDESESTPVAEGWVKPKPRRWRPRIWPWGRS